MYISDVLVHGGKRRIASTRYDEALWWRREELGPHGEHYDLSVRAAIKTHQTTLQTRQIITISFIENIGRIYPLVIQMFRTVTSDNPPFQWGPFSPVLTSILTTHVHRAVGLCSRSRHSNIKGGRMIVLENRKLPLSTDFFIVKYYPYFQKR